MHLIAIGDIHGRNVWKEVKEKPSDKLIFIGDYVDPHRPIPDEDVIQNLEEIIEFRRQEPERVVLLLGNHDAQYLHYPDYPCSGYRADLQSVYGKLFQENKELFQIAFQYKKTLFTHAGVSGKWYSQHRQIWPLYPATTFADTLNSVYQSEHRDILFEAGAVRGGSDRCSGPIWADKSETQSDYFIFHQVVGHSRVPHITRMGGPVASITYIDVFDTP